MTTSLEVARISLAEPLEREALRQFVMSSPDCHPMAMPSYLERLRTTMGTQVDVWGVRKDERWQAILPVFRSARGKRPRCVTPALTPYTGVVVSAEAHASLNLYLEATGLLARVVASEYRDARHVHLPAIQDVRAWQWSGWTASPSYTYVHDLRAELAPSRAVKKHVRKCIESQHHVSSAWDLDRAWPVIADTIRRQGVGIGMTRESFFAFASAVAEAGLAWMVTGLTKEGEAASVRLQLGVSGTTSAFDWVAGSSTSLLSSGASSWLVTQTIADCRQRGFETWDMCGAQYESIARFKSEFGGRLAHAFAVFTPPSLAMQVTRAIRAPVGVVVRALRRRGLGR